MCSICYEDDGDLKINNYDYYHCNCLHKWINMLNLSIDIENADLEEWVITCLNDTFDDNITIRLRNPATNLPFSTTELTNIFHKLKL